MVGHIAQIAVSLKMTIDTLRKDYAGRTTDVCALIRCPRLEAYETALRGTIEVLRKTKNAFKSKELAALRERLEEFLRKDHRSQNRARDQRPPWVCGGDGCLRIAGF